MVLSIKVSLSLSHKRDRWLQRRKSPSWISNKSWSKRCIERPGWVQKYIALSLAAETEQPQEASLNIECQSLQRVKCESKADNSGEWQPTSQRLKLDQECQRLSKLWEVINQSRRATETKELLIYLVNQITYKEKLHTHMLHSNVFPESKLYSYFNVMENIRSSLQTKPCMSLVLNVLG